MMFEVRYWYLGRPEQCVFDTLRDAMSFADEFLPSERPLIIGPFLRALYERLANGDTDNGRMVSND